MKKITFCVSYVNRHLEDNDNTVCKWLTDYIHTSYMYEKQNIDKSWLKVQPGWPNETVIGYRHYYDEEGYGHRSNRLILTFKSGTETDISLYKFKRFIRSRNIFYFNIWRR